MIRCYNRSYVYRLLKNFREVFWERWILNWVKIIDMILLGIEVGLRVLGVFVVIIKCVLCDIFRDNLI